MRANGKTLAQRWLDKRPDRVSWIAASKEVLYKIQFNRCGAAKSEGEFEVDAGRSHFFSMTSADNEILIQGITHEGRRFRPSDWAERLAGVMSQFRPGSAAKQPGRYLGYSPWCVPTVTDGVKCIVVNTALREYEPMAWDFVMNFARDNDLQVVETCQLAESK